MNIVGVDPGRTTGLCLVVDGAAVLLHTASSLETVWDWLGDQYVDLIVMEDFFGGIQRNAKDPLQVIGAVRVWAYEYDVPIVMQSPAILHGTKVVHRNPHIRSALAHATHYIETHGEVLP